MQSNFWADSKNLDQHKNFCELYKDKAFLLLDSMSVFELDQNLSNLIRHALKLMKVAKLVAVNIWAK